MPDSSRLEQLSKDPFIEQFAQRTLQPDPTEFAEFVAPRITIYGSYARYKTWGSNAPYYVPDTRRSIGGSVPKISDTGDMESVMLEHHGIDRVIDFTEELEDDEVQGTLKNAIMEASSVAKLSFTKSVVDLMRTVTSGNGYVTQTIGVGTDWDPIQFFDTQIDNLHKRTWNSGPIKMVIGREALKRIRANKNIRGVLSTGSDAGNYRQGYMGDGGTGLKVLSLGELSRSMIESIPARLAEGFYSDSPLRPETAANRFLDNDIFLFVSHSTPNQQDTSWIKNFVNARNWMKMGTYPTEDRRGNVVKIDWSYKPVITNDQAVIRIVTS